MFPKTSTPLQDHEQETRGSISERALLNSLRKAPRSQKKAQVSVNPVNHTHRHIEERFTISDESDPEGDNVSRRTCVSKNANRSSIPPQDVTVDRPSQDDRLPYLSLSRGAPPLSNSVKSFHGSEFAAGSPLRVQTAQNRVKKPTLKGIVEYDSEGSDKGSGVSQLKVMAKHERDDAGHLLRKDPFSRGNYGARQLMASCADASCDRHFPDLRQGIADVGDKEESSAMTHAVEKELLGRLSYANSHVSYSPSCQHSHYATQLQSNHSHSVDVSTRCNHHFQEVLSKCPHAYISHGSYPSGSHYDPFHYGLSGPHHCTSGHHFYGGSCSGLSYDPSHAFGPEFDQLGSRVTDFDRHHSGEIMSSYQRAFGHHYVATQQNNSRLEQERTMPVKVSFQKLVKCLMTILECRAPYQLPLRDVPVAVRWAFGHAVDPERDLEIPLGWMDIFNRVCDKMIRVTQNELGDIFLELRN